MRAHRARSLAVLPSLSAAVERPVMGRGHATKTAPTDDLAFDPP